MSDIESSDWSEIAANNIQPAPGGWPPNSSPNIVYNNGREEMGAIKRWWDRINPTISSGGSANAQTLTFIQGPTAYVQGQSYSFFVGFNNTGPTTLNVNGLGAKNIFFGGAALTGGELLVGGIVEVVYDSTQFHIIGATGAGKASLAGYLPLAGGAMSGNLAVPQIVLSGAAGSFRTIAARTVNVQRWQLDLANSDAESSGNLGSNFALSRYTDAGGILDQPLTINRASGLVTLAGPGGVSISGAGGLSVTGTATFSSTLLATGQVGISNAVGTQRILFWHTSGSPRWSMMADQTAEGSNNGSNFLFTAYNDSGVGLGSVFSVIRSTQVVTFGKAIVNGPSDRSLKENIAPLEGSLDKVQQLKGVSFNFIKDDAKRRQIGLVAQDVAPVVPEVMQDFIQEGEEPKLAIDYTRLVPLLVEAIKELTAKVARLEAGLAAAATA